jgi:hypothetical protein
MMRTGKDTFSQIEAEISTQKRDLFKAVRRQTWPPQQTLQPYYVSVSRLQIG